MRSICQLAPRIEEGTGVGAVAAALTRAFAATGRQVDRFTLADAGYRPIATSTALTRNIEHLIEVVYFSTVGSARARAYLRRNPDSWSICHNDLLAGDIYVNHGLLRVAMASRSHPTLRMLRNPVHVFTQARDWWRFTYSGAHRAVVHLTEAERRSFHRLYPRSTLRCEVIGNGVDTSFYQPADAAAKLSARRQLGLPADAFVVAFAGHEFGRKGLDLLLASMPALPDHVHLAAAGGSPRERADRSSTATAAGLAGRVHLLGALPDSRCLLHAADLLALPSSYEAYSLIVLEALACGVPVLATRVGAAPDLLLDGHNGYLVDRAVPAISDAIRRAVGADRDALGANARATAADHSWDQVAEKYVSLLTELRGDAEQTNRAAVAG